MTSWHKFIIQAGINVVTACILAFIHEATWLTALLLLPLLAITYWVQPAPAMRWLMGLAILMGFAGEIWAVYWGVWAYADYDFWGIPLYIGLAWGLMAVFLASLYQALTDWLRT